MPCGQTPLHAIRGDHTWCLCRFRQKPVSAPSCPTRPEPHLPRFSPTNIAPHSHFSCVHLLRPIPRSFSCPASGSTLHHTLNASSRKPKSPAPIPPLLPRRFKYRFPRPELPFQRGIRPRDILLHAAFTAQGIPPDPLNLSVSLQLNSLPPNHLLTPRIVENNAQIPIPQPRKENRQSPSARKVLCLFCVKIILSGII